MHCRNGRPAREKNVKNPARWPGQRFMLRLGCADGLKVCWPHHSGSASAAQDARLAAVVKGDNGKLNYGVGAGTKDEADRLGKIWVGEGARPTSDGSGLVSADGTRIYRSPKEKPNAPGSLNPTGIQANFESYTKNIETGKMDKVGNGHLNIMGEK